MSLAGPNRKPALTAAASKIGYSRQTAAKLKELPWQDRAWQVYEAEGSIYFMTRYRSAVARKVDYFVGTVDRPGDDPDIDITYNDEGEVLSLGAATKVLEAEGGPELIRRLVSELMVHWDVPGEAYLVRFDVEPFWRILSTQELRKQGDTFTWGDDTTEKGSIDPDGVFRVWKPHPRFHWEPDSPTKHILEDAEELILLRRELKARSQSRLPSGAWILPDTVDFTPFGEDGNGTPDDFARELTNHMSMAVKDAGSAASLVPWILTVDRADHPLVVGGYVSFTRDWEVNLEQRDALLRSIATGLDVPPEILTGMADLNHWSAWLVSEQAVSQHVAPTVDDILDSLTVNWFRPLLEASAVDPDGYVLWRDISPATVPPDRTGVALDLYRENVISDVAVRRVSDFDEDDAPETVEEGAPVMDAAELLQRINAFGTLRRAGAEWDDAVRAVGLPPIAQIPGLLPITVRAEEVVKNEEPVIAAIDDLLGGDPPLPGAAVTAAVRRRIVATELADLDAELLAWVVEEADKEIDRLLNLALTAANDPIDESMLVPLAQRLEAKIAQAQAAARGWLSRTLGRTPSDEGESLARSQGVQVILAGIVEAVRRKLFTPDARPDPIDLGRMPNITTPTEAIRHGLSLAGGGPAVYEDGNTSELIGNGQKVKEELAGDGFFVDGYEWKYGNPANTFEPHLRLDGVQFTSWEDPRLAVGIGDSWLRRSHYRPGDHRGCQCAFVQVIVEAALELGEGRAVGPAGAEANIQTLDDFRAWAKRHNYDVVISDWVGPEEMAGIRQAVQAIDDMNRKYPFLQGEWVNHPMSLMKGRRRGLTGVTLGQDVPFGAGASVKGRTFLPDSKLGIVDFDSSRYAAHSSTGAIVGQNVYDAVIHEMGHVVNNTLGRGNRLSDPGNFDKIINDARRTVWKSGRTVDFQTVRRDLSNYAVEEGADATEFWAEAFAARNSPTVSALLSPEAATRLNEFARIVNEKAREVYGLTEDVI